MGISEGCETTDPKSPRRPQNAVSLNAVWPSSIVGILASPCAYKLSTTIQDYKEDTPQNRDFKCRASEPMALLSPCYGHFLFFFGGERDLPAVGDGQTHHTDNEQMRTRSLLVTDGHSGEGKPMKTR